MSSLSVPSNIRDRIEVFFVANDFYAKYLAVSIVSIIVNTTHRIHFHIIDGGSISADNKSKLLNMKSIRDFDIDFHKVDEKLFANMPKSSQKHISNETNFRFCVSSIGHDIDKCILLDADLILDADISALWDIDVTNVYIAAVADQAALRPKSWAKDLPLPANYEYINTGVSVLNLKRWRDEGIESKLFGNLERYRNLLLFPDQDTLNITLASKVAYISPIFNALPVQNYWDKNMRETAFHNPVVIHWAGYKKPWKTPSYPLAHLFFKYARMTPFYEDILYSDIYTNILDETHKLLSESSPISEKTSYPKEIAQLKTVLSELAALHKYRVKLRQIRIKICFSWGKRKQHYKEQKRHYKTKIRNIMQLIERL